MQICKINVPLVFLGFLFFMIFPLTGISQSSDEKKILETLRLEEKYWSSGDIDAYVSLYAPTD